MEYRGKNKTSLVCMKIYSFVGHWVLEFSKCPPPQIEALELGECSIRFHGLIVSYDSCGINRFHFV